MAGYIATIKGRLIEQDLKAYPLITAKPAYVLWLILFLKFKYGHRHLIANPDSNCSLLSICFKICAAFKAIHVASAIILFVSSVRKILFQCVGRILFYKHMGISVATGEKLWDVQERSVSILAGSINIPFELRHWTHFTSTLHHL